MRIFLAFCLLALSAVAHGVYSVGLTHPYTWQVVRIVDGDTVVVEATWLPPELGTTISIRLNGVDTPEREWRARCDRERELAEEATVFVEKHLRTARNYEVIITGWDKFGGRVLGDFLLDGKLLTELLLDNNLAQPYTGSGPKPNWC